MDDGQDLYTKTTFRLHVASHVTVFTEFVWNSRISQYDLKQ